MDTCIWLTESLCYIPETNNIVNQLYSNIKFKKKYIPDSSSSPGGKEGEINSSTAKDHLCKVQREAKSLERSYHEHRQQSALSKPPIY